MVKTFAHGLAFAGKGRQQSRAKIHGAWLAQKDCVERGQHKSGIVQIRLNDWKEVEVHFSDDLVL